MALITNSQHQFFARSMRYSDVELVVENEVAAYTYPWTKQNFIDLPAKNEAGKQHAYMHITHSRSSLA